MDTAPSQAVTVTIDRDITHQRVAMETQHRTAK